MVDLTRKLGVASVVVTHEMDSAFVIADRMAMFNKGVMLCVRERAYFEQLRDAPDDRLDALTDDEKLIRQFLRGDAEGPMSDQQADNSSYAKDLLQTQNAITGSTPSVMTTRRKARGAMETAEFDG
jgi:ABC-type transporter Mla maintaining outer membrane lipid asymmetry ATPase subunit MlaF